MELSNSTVTAVGRCFSNALDHVTAHTLADHHTLGLLLIDALRRSGFKLTAPAPVAFLHPLLAQRWHNADPSADLSQEVK